MPLHTNRSLDLGTNPLLGTGLCYDDGQEDLANSEHGGRWVGGALTLRWSIKDITAPPFSFAPNSLQDAMILQLPASPNWGFHITDAIIQAKIDVGPAPSGAYDFRLGTNSGPSHDDIIVGGSDNPTWPPTVHTFQGMAGGFGPAVGFSGVPAFRTYRQVYLRWDASGFLTLNTSQASVVLFGYLVPDATDSTS